MWRQACPNIPSLQNPRGAILNFLKGVWGKILFCVTHFNTMRTHYALAHYLVSVNVCLGMKFRHFGFIRSPSSVSKTNDGDWMTLNSFYC